jgi:Protein of unknown function (DUF2889)
VSHQHVVPISLSRLSPDPSQRPLWPGTTGAAFTTPARQPNSIRRTTSIDIEFTIDGLLCLSGRGRDLYTRLDNTTDEIASAETRVEANLVQRQATAVRTDDPVTNAALQSTVGTSIGGRFRSAVSAAIPEHVATGSLYAQLLDDTPVTSMIAGASLARRGLITKDKAQGRRGPAVDVCAGWKHDGVMVAAIAEDSTEEPYMGEGPLAPSLLVAADPLAWHELEPLSIGSMRRARRFDLSLAPDGGGIVVEALFRDSYMEPPFDDQTSSPAGIESVVHEYELNALLDVTGVVVSINAIPHVLPSPECPVAAASALRVVGMAMKDIRAHITSDFSGISTCTHLNDLLRAFGNLWTAANQLSANAQ